MAKNALTDKPIAVLIDAENVPQPKLMLGLLRELGKVGVVGLRRVYGSEIAVRKWMKDAMEFGLEPVVRSGTSGRKNATDFVLTIDALDLMHSGKFGAFCIVSGDSDFLPLVQRIRGEGLAVYNCAEEKKASTDQAVYSGFFAVKAMLELAVPSKSGELANAKEKAAGVSALLEPSKKVLSKFCDILDAAGGSQQKISLGSLGQRLRRDYPDFKVKQFNHATLGKFLLDTFECTKKDGKGVTHVRLRKQTA